VNALAVSGARGTAVSDLIPATIVAILAVAGVVALGVAHRRGRTRVLARTVEFSDRVSVLPAWAAIPTVVATVSLLVAAFGFYWDVSWHIDRGRDPGPFANPAHWFIIAGLAGIAFAGCLAVIIGNDKPTASSVSITKRWHVPVGGLLLLVCGLIALAGFPLDDVWHRIFGQDVTLWGPTHIQMIGGASLATLAMWVLVVEGLRNRREGQSRPAVRRVIGAQDVLIGGAFLIGLSTLQGEFDFGVPQFRQLYHPVMIMLAAGIALVAVRIRAGKGGALGAALFFLALRGLLTLLIGPLLGRTTLHFPLYLAEALLVEAVALRVPTTRQLTFGAWSGLAIGTVGLAAEWAWSRAWMPLPWGHALWPGGALLALAAALAGGVIGGLVGRSLAEPGMPRQATPRGLAAAAWVVAVACLAIPNPVTFHHNHQATITLADAHRRPGPWLTATVRLDPPDLAHDANWFNVTAWQGARTTDGGLVIAKMERVGPGTYRTREPFPAYGEWKAILRLHKGKALEVVPLYMPLDPAIPAPEVRATSNFRTAFVSDKQVLQRENIGGTPGLRRAAYAAVALIAVAWVASLGWGLRRLNDTAAATRPRRAQPVGAPVPAVS